MQALNGFRDFYPDAMAQRNFIFEKWKSISGRYGFVEYDGPALESLDLFTKKSGEEIVGQLYNFVDKGERPVTLRPEMTPTFARMIAARHRDFKKPMKWMAVPQVFRYERPQKGRLREHYQLNCDIVGEESLSADVELIACLIDTLKSFGLTSQDFVIRMSDRQFWIDFLKENGVPESEWYAKLQAIDKSEREKPEVTKEKLGPLAEKIEKIFLEGAPSERISTVVQGLKAMGLGDFVQVDFRIVRGLAYYTGIVFEAFDRSGEFRAIAGGGRYDSLLKNLCDVDLPALGFGMGDVVLGELLKSKNLLPTIAKKIDYYVAIPDEKYREQALGLIHQLREAGRSVEYSFTAAKLGKQFEAAESRGALKIIIVDALMEEEKVSLKTVATRDQISISVKDLFL
ncbi:MAG: histidine--tRNA ligase [Verrucomicrobiota bacterium]